MSQLPETSTRWKLAPKKISAKYGGGNSRHGNWVLRGSEEKHASIGYEALDSAPPDGEAIIC
jgi:hypothetical protein